MTLHGMEYDVGEFKSDVLAASPPKVLPAPRILLGGGVLDGVRDRESPDAVQALFSNS